MNKFIVIPLDQDKYGVGRWNEVTKKYEPIGDSYSSGELAEIAKQHMVAMYNEENQQQ